MKLIAKADVVLALGTRLGPFGTLPQYGIDYWPKDAKIIQIDADAKMLGLVKPIRVGHLRRREGGGAGARRAAHRQDARVHREQAMRGSPTSLRSRRRGKPSSTAGRTRPTRGRSRCAKSSTYMHPRQMLRELERAMPADAMVSTDIGNICSVSNSYLRFERPRSMFAAMSFGNCGYAFPTIIGAKVAAPDRPAIAYVGDGAWGMSFGEIQTCVREEIPVTAVVFNNGQWGAEKKNHVDFYNNRFLGVNLDKQPSWAAVAKAMGAEGQHDREARRRRSGVARGGEGAARRQDDDPRDDGDARAGRPVPARRAGAADAPPRQVPIDGREARLTREVEGAHRRGAPRMSELREAPLETAADDDPASAVGALIDRARVAQRAFETWTQARVDEAVTAAAWAIMEPARNRALAELAVRATGLGDVADKIAKNHRKTLGLLRDLAGAQIGRRDQRGPRARPDRDRAARRRRRRDHAVDQSGARHRRTTS